MCKLVECDGPRSTAIHRNDHVGEVGSSITVSKRIRSMNLKQHLRGWVNSIHYRDTIGNGIVDKIYLKGGVVVKFGLVGRC